MSHTKFGNKQSRFQTQTDQIFISQPVQPMTLPQFACAYDLFCYYFLPVLNTDIVPLRKVFFSQGHFSMFI